MVREGVKLVALCGSAGSFKLILEMLENIPADNRSAWIVMIHRSNESRNSLPGLLQNHSYLPVKEAEDKEKLASGVVYVAPTGYHLLLDEGLCWALDCSEPLWFSRPSIDLLFHSMADSQPEKMCAFLLSGANEDGAAGLKSLKRKGAYTLVQNPADAEYAAMPGKAIELEKNHRIFTGEDIKPLYQELFKK